MDGRETVGNSLGRPSAGGSCGNEDRVDRNDAVGNSLRRAPVGRSDTGRKGNRGKELGESSGGKERYGSDDGVGGRETVGNSLGRAPVGRSDTGMTTGWTEGKPWEIAWGELRWERAI